MNQDSTTKPKRGQGKHLQTCKRCGHKFDNNKAKCTSCGIWNTPGIISNDTDQTILLSEVSDSPLEKIKSGPWDPCFSDTSKGGGIVTTGVTLIGGAPGAGKSTMSLQLADQVSLICKREVIYVGAEESVEEVKSRAMRLKLKSMDRIRMHPMGSSADLGSILITRKPCAIILDSLPGLVGDPEMAVELCKRFKDYAVELKAPVMIIDHVTKDLDFAGFMQLQHCVDTTLTLNVGNNDDWIPCKCEIPCEPRRHQIRELTTVKNRFGPASITTLLAMTATGLILVNEKDLIDDDEDEDEDNDEDDNDEENEDD